MANHKTSLIPNISNIIKEILSKHIPNITKLEIENLSYKHQNHINNYKDTAIIGQSHFKIYINSEFLSKENKELSTKLKQHKFVYNLLKKNNIFEDRDNTDSFGVHSVELCINK
ncbi:hypothetical protein QEN19_003178 [Hanseniaspora menglaensis]